MIIQVDALHYRLGQKNRVQRALNHPSYPAHDINGNSSVTFSINLNKEKMSGAGQFSIDRLLIYIQKYILL